MSMTFNQMFEQALVMLGVLDPNQTPSTSESDAALLVANNMIQNLSLERLNIMTIVQAAANLVSGTSSYTFGPAGTFGTTRYVKLMDAGILKPNQGGTGNTRSPVRLIDEHEYWAIYEKGSLAVSPTVFYYDMAYPVATGYLWPTPNFNTITPQLEVQAWQVLTSFPDKTTAVDFPYGYDEALVFQFARRLIAQYSVRADTVPTILDQAERSLAALRALNASLPGQNPAGGPTSALAAPPAATA